MTRAIDRAVDEARKAAGLPPESEAEKQDRKEKKEKIGGCGDQMMKVGCG